jgi:hypothetical protein
MEARVVAVVVLEVAGPTCSIKSGEVAESGRMELTKNWRIGELGYCSWRRASIILSSKLSS